MPWPGFSHAPAKSLTSLPFVSRDFQKRLSVSKAAILYRAFAEAKQKVFPKAPFPNWTSIRVVTLADPALFL